MLNTINKVCLVFLTLFFIYWIVKFIMLPFKLLGRIAGYKNKDDSIHDWKLGHVGYKVSESNPLIMCDLCDKVSYSYNSNGYLFCSKCAEIFP